MPDKEDLATHLRGSRVGLGVICSRLRLTEAHMPEVHDILKKEKEGDDDAVKWDTFVEDLSTFLTSLPVEDVYVGQSISGTMDTASIVRGDSSKGHRHLRDMLPSYHPGGHMNSWCERVKQLALRHGQGLSDADQVDCIRT